jgi:hypothetical protein
MKWKTWQIRHADASGPGIAIRSLETQIWGQTDYSTPEVLVLDADGVTWEINACADRPEQWRIYRKQPGREPVLIPVGTLDARVETLYSRARAE